MRQPVQKHQHKKEPLFEQAECNRRSIEESIFGRNLWSKENCLRMKTKLLQKDNNTKLKYTGHNSNHHRNQDCFELENGRCFQIGGAAIDIQILLAFRRAKIRVNVRRVGNQRKLPKVDLELMFVSGHA